MIIGDFNVNRAKNVQLKRFLENSTFKRANTPPTFLMENNADSTPDLILFTNNLEKNIKKVETHPDIGSDHLAIEITIDLQATITEEEETTINYHNCNMEKVNDIMKAYIREIQRHQLDKDTIKIFHEKLSQTIIEQSPIKRRKYYQYELPPFIVRLIKNKRKMYREYKSNPNPDYKTYINNYNKNIHRLIQQYKESKWLNICSEINKEQGRNYWQQIRKLTKYKPTSHIPTIKENNRSYSTDLEKTEVFAEYFDKTYTEDHNILYYEANYEDVKNWYNNYFNNSPQTENHNIEEEEYFAVINKGKSTAPGIDHITKQMVRKLDYDVHLFIIKIYEYCLNHQYFPPEWKQGIIITIPKPNTNHSKVENHRPITLLPVVAKNFEKIILKRLHSSIGQCIPNYQFGFKEKTSTIHPLTIITSNIQTSKLIGQRSAAVFLDISKAFDSVWHAGLLYKLMRLNCPRYLIYLLKDYLNQRRLQVKIKLNFSKEFTPQQGVPQGSPLSPMLYNVYCHDILSELENTNNFNPNLYILQYADDTALISHNTKLNETIEELQRLLDAIIEWCNKWRTKVNPAKSQFIIFNHNINIDSPTIRINNRTLSSQTSVKYLGVNLDQKLNFNSHTKLIKKNVFQEANTLEVLPIRTKELTKKLLPIFTNPYADRSWNIATLFI